MNCLNCNQPLKATRKTKKFCTPYCRLVYSRTHKLVPDPIGNLEADPPEPLQPITPPATTSPKVHCKDCLFAPIGNSIPNWYREHLKGNCKSKADAIEKIFQEVYSKVG